MSDGKLEWFNGNHDALALYRMFVHVAHVWDDLIDKDKEVSQDEINTAFNYCLISIPANSVYRAMFQQLHPLLMTGVIGYAVANKYEADKDAHGLELAHTLRYAVAQVFVLIITQLNGSERALGILPEALKEMMPERITDYIKEHTNGNA